MNRYLTELIGTFFLVLTIGCSVIGIGPRGIPPLAIGAILMVMVYAGGHVSGGHYNPAVTLGIWIRGRCTSADLAPYWVSQIVGALGGAFVTRYLMGPPQTGPMALQTGAIFVGEFLYTFALVYVVLNAATAKGTSGNSFYGLAIGMTVMAGAFAVGGISGGAFNPAVAIGASVIGFLSPSIIWEHILAELAAGAVAALAFKFINPDDK